MPHRALLAFLLLAIGGSFAFAQNVPPGQLTKHSFSESKIFPGTVRDYWVYVPDQYRDLKPDQAACVYVNQDGVQFDAPQVMDTLIFTGDMPVTVGIFVAPGRVPSPDGDKALDRYNRSYEYDGLGDNYARFLLDELLPHVEKTHNLRLSKDGNDRAIGGASSGAIAAFTAAWERPDGFTRVFSAIGTYVGLRGGNDYPTLIRKFEPKPIRIFLEDGAADLNIYGGDWWMANQTMQRALAFAGYEVSHKWGDGGHNQKHATEIYQQAMKFLWKGYPQRVKAGLGSPQLQEILIEGEGWKLVGEGYRFTEGATTGPTGEVFFNDVGAGKTYRVSHDGKVSVFLEDSKRGDGQEFGPDGRIYSNCAATKQVIAWDKDGKASVIADDLRGNDIVVRQDGGMYVTDPFSTPGKSNVVFVSKTGEKKVVDTGLRFANGCTMSPDQSLLYVADMHSHWVYSYQAQPDGSLKYKQKYYHLHMPDTADDSGADGMCVDRDGRLYVATRLGIQVCDQAGRVNCIIPTPNGKCANLTIGGKDYDTLYVNCGNKVYSRKLKVKGAHAWQEPSKPTKPRL